MKGSIPGIPTTAILLSLSLLILVLLPGVSAQGASVNLISAPSSVSPGQDVTISWQVAGSGKITHTAIHWDTKPGNPDDFRSYSRATPDFASINPPHDAPREYTVTFTAPDSGTMHFVVHAFVDGGALYNPEGEMTITIAAGQAPPVPQDSSQDLMPILVLVSIIVVVAVVALVASRSRKKK